MCGAVPPLLCPEKHWGGRVPAIISTQALRDFADEEAVYLHLLSNVVH